MRNTPSTRGEETRDRLLDALETFVAAQGLAKLSHRALARAAGVRPGLVHYHFGTLDQAIGQAIARRSEILVQLHVAAIAQIRARERYTIAELVAAWWRPFDGAPGSRDRSFDDWCCLVARLSRTAQGERALETLLAPSIALLRPAIVVLAPAADDALVHAGLAHVWTLFEREILARRCEDAEPTAAANPSRMLRFAAAGLERMLAPAEKSANRTRG